MYRPEGARLLPVVGVGHISVCPGSQRHAACARTPWPAVNTHAIGGAPPRFDRSPVFFIALQEDQGNVLAISSDRLTRPTGDPPPSCSASTCREPPHQRTSHGSPERNHAQDVLDECQARFASVPACLIPAPRTRTARLTPAPTRRSDHGRPAHDPRRILRTGLARRILRAVHTDGCPRFAGRPARQTSRV